MKIAPKHQRLLMILVGLAMLTAGVLLILSTLRENVIYFRTPSEVVTDGRKFRLGGLVEQGSVKTEGEQVRFKVTDGKAALAVEYRGPLPSLFREGQGVIAEGVLEGEVFKATRILAKHDENYMPKDVADKLKKSGYWKP